MAELHDRQQSLSGNAALAALPPADQPERSSDEVDPADTTSILQGSQAFTSKASRNGAWRAFLNDPFGLYTEAKTKKDERDAQEARERASLARWNEQLTVVGGVEMTNQEAQAARQRVIDNDDAYADWAIARGKMNESDRDEFKRVIRRKMELEDKRGRGTLTAAEAEEEREIDRSRAGQAADAATAASHQKRGPDAVAVAKRNVADDVLSRPISVAGQAQDAVFQDYAAATAVPAKTLQAERPSTKVAATGLDL